MPFPTFFSKSFIPRSPHTAKYELTTTTFSNNSIEEHDILRSIKKIKPKKTAEPEQIPAFLIKDCAHVIIQSLTFFSNLFLKTQTFPSEWKLSKIIPVFKAGDKTYMFNYGFIIFINIFAKIFKIAFQEIIYFQMSAYFSKSY